VHSTPVFEPQYELDDSQRDCGQRPSGTTARRAEQRDRRQGNGDRGPVDGTHCVAPWVCSWCSARAELCTPTARLRTHPRDGPHPPCAPEVSRPRKARARAPRTELASGAPELGALEREHRFAQERNVPRRAGRAFRSSASAAQGIAGRPAARCGAAAPMRNPRRRGLWIRERA